MCSFYPSASNDGDNGDGGGGGEGRGGTCRRQSKIEIRREQHSVSDSGWRVYLSLSFLYPTSPIAIRLPRVRLTLLFRDISRGWTGRGGTPE